ncbi:DUF7657 domain-containing protein [Cryobacterium luteum]|uniref:4-amino-4-deoxy-L-arabinose transferase n=1 Tax=Cryobacterium luteum TaxID=1424661 RepID=A0A1H8KQG1_9MICO|nr:hypothetical protein [Cryobacterium luteum]TFB95043.1 hypothetical protein E3O10_00965 [Cryobacterium luteum]SEN95117.1 hypothetical protein SAMN05216281_12049 [Cryobacterium luteum]
MRVNNGASVIALEKEIGKVRPRGLAGVLVSVRGKHRHLVMPRESGLPNLLVVFGIPLLMLLGLIVLVMLGISGSSTGVYWETFGGPGVDPALLAGEPRGIRSDEWLVQSSWIVSQAQSGFGALNSTLPGGMDATVQNDLPSWDWSSIFRPHTAGLLFLPLDQGMAWRWWFPAFAVLVSVYWFCVSLLPRRPCAATMFAVAVLCSPLLQWWFLPITLWPVAWAFLAMTAIAWAFRSHSVAARVAWAVLTGYVTITMAMSIYVPFMIPAILVVLFFAIGSVLTARFRESQSWSSIARSLVPIASAGLFAVIVMVIWIVTRIETIRAVTSTVYPGLRIEATGTLNTIGQAAALFSGPFQKALFVKATDVLSSNQSEASTPLLLIAFLIVPMVWLGIRSRRSQAVPTDWLLLSTVACFLVVVAFLVVPNWDALAHLLLLDRSTASRMRLAFVLLGIVGIVLLIRRIDERTARVPMAIAVLAAGTVVAATATVWWYMYRHESQILEVGQAYIVTTILLALAVFFVCRGYAAYSAVSFMTASLIVGFGVNPLYSGVFDLRETQAGKEISVIETSDPTSTWVGVGSYVPTALLVESGVQAFNGVQTYPPEEMWSDIDPAGVFEQEWNRLANVNWTPGVGEPVVTNPVRDQIMVSFDSCSTFAQGHVSNVVSDIELPQMCLTEISEERQGASKIWIYEVDSPRDRKSQG